jgi:hypothetical protein
MNHIAAAIFQAVAEEVCLLFLGILRDDQQNFGSGRHFEVPLIKESG